jgi:predicted RNase H-like nuclease (RuvC/YqgF family)
MESKDETAKGHAQQLDAGGRLAAQSGLTEHEVRAARHDLNSALEALFKINDDLIAYIEGQDAKVERAGKMVESMQQTIDRQKKELGARGRRIEELEKEVAEITEEFEQYQIDVQ